MMCCMAPRIASPIALQADEHALSVFDPRWLHWGHCVPLRVESGTLHLAVGDHPDREQLDEIAFSTGLALQLLRVDSDALHAALETVRRQFAALARQRDGAALLGELSASGENPSSMQSEVTGVDDAPVVRYLHGLLSEAARSRVSDIHFEPFEQFYRVRFRRDGVLAEIARPPLAVRDRLAARIKVLAQLDIAERRLPQDGRIRIRLDDGQALDLRVSTLPTLFGEKIVLRLLRDAVAGLAIEQLGLEPDQQSALLQALDRPHGMLLVTGPTGSGKTLTLYTLLQRLNREGVNIATAEDPVEMHLPGINQVAINDRTGLGFAGALRAFLRQDPDTLMVGEIRDLETADIAIKAAQTGHRVLSTLHTRDAPGTLARLMNMGIAPFHIAASVRLITAQRLVRRLCTVCRQPLALDLDSRRAAGFSGADLEADWTAWQPRGCPACDHTGFHGRIGVHQVMPVSEAMRRLILRRADVQALSGLAGQEGIRTLHACGLAKVRAGLTSLDEIEANCHD